MLDENFLESFGFSPCASFDASKFTIDGHGLGGLTSVFASEGDQTIFKCCLSHDAAVYFTDRKFTTIQSDLMYQLKRFIAQVLLTVCKHKDLDTQTE